MRSLLIRLIPKPLLLLNERQQKAVTVTKEEQAGFVIHSFLLAPGTRKQREEDPSFQGQTGYVPLKYTEVSNLIPP